MTGEAVHRALAGWAARFEWVRTAPRALRTVPSVLRLVWDAHRAYSVALVALVLAQGLQPVAALWITKLVIDAAVRAMGPDTAPTGMVAAAREVLGLVALAGLLTLAHRLVEPAATLVQTQLGDSLAREIQHRVLAKTNSLADISRFEDPSFYDSLQRAAGTETTYRPMGALLNMAAMLRLVVQLTALAAVVAAFGPMLVLVLLATAAPTFVLQLRGQVQAYAVTDSSVPEIRRMRYFGELIAGRDAAKELRLFDLAGFFFSRFLDAWAAFHRRFSELRLRHCRWSASISALTSLGNAGVYAYFVLLALARRVTLGDLALYTQAVGQFQSTLGELLRRGSDLYGALLYIGRIFEFLDAPPAMRVLPAGEARVVPLPLRRGVELRDVTFVYPGTDRPVLDRLNLRIAPGESIALVGENGAGKTTIVKLLTRLYDPTEGQVLVDGTDLRDLDLEQWRSRVAVIFQDFAQYHLPARMNIGLGDLARLDDLRAVEAAAARGGAAAVIQKLEDGYDTVLGRWLSATDSPVRSNVVVREGAELSSGEWQKIALSRAFMRVGGPYPPGGGAAPAGAQLLILDEPTAALDPQSEYDVYVRFHELTRGRSTLLISHRFSTVKMADRIVVLEHGRIVEEGSHDELAARGGTYADMYEKQAARYRQPHTRRPALDHPADGRMTGRAPRRRDT